jgi:DNA-binding NarL/FixJ family response regulator
LPGVLAGVSGPLGSKVVQSISCVAGKRYLSAAIIDVVVGDYLERPEKAEPSPLESLSARGREILQLVVEGKSSAQIAEVLFLSPKTVETYRSRAMQKLGIKDLAALVKFAIQHGLIGLD